MSTIIGNIKGSDIVEEDDGTARMVNSANLRVMRLRATRARHWMCSRMPAVRATGLAS